MHYYITSTHKVFLMKVDEWEGKRDVQRLILARVSGTLAWLERNHQVHPSRRTSSLEQWDELGTKDLLQKSLELSIDTYKHRKLWWRRQWLPAKFEVLNQKLSITKTKTSSSFSAHGKIGNFIIIITPCYRVRENTRQIFGAVTVG